MDLLHPSLRLSLIDFLPSGTLATLSNESRAINHIVYYSKEDQKTMIESLQKDNISQDEEYLELKYYQGPNRTWTLDLSGEELTSLAGMPELPQLQILKLSWNQLTSLDGIPELPELQRLDLSGNQFTPGTIADFRRQHPRIKVIY